MRNPFSIFFGKQSHYPKPYKLENHRKTLRIGVVGSSLKNIKEQYLKALETSKEKISLEDLRVVLSADGTEVDDEAYLETLPPHTSLMILHKDETWLPDVKSSLSSLLEAIDLLLKASEENRERLSEAHSQLPSSTDGLVNSIIGNVVSAVTSNIGASSKEDDPEWFKGVEDRFTHKEDVMKDAAKRRMRSYLYTAKDYIKDNCKGDLKKSMDLVAKEFEKVLKRNDYYGELFSRSISDPGVRICDQMGWFQCEGPYDQDDCDMPDHLINPYANYSSRILFSSWNLDHRIEKSREILPRLCEAVENIPQMKKLNWMYFYELLFTRKNLKLVHVVCHDKKEHSEAKCEPALFYT